MPKGATTRPRRSARLRKSAGGVAPRKPTARRKKTRKPVQEANDDNSDDEDDNDDDGDHPTGSTSHPPSQETIPARVRRPTPTLIHGNLTSAWQLNKELEMCFIFDAVLPARRFKRGMPYTDDGDFPDYNEGEAGNVTEMDSGPPGLMPYAVYTYR